MVYIIPEDSVLTLQLSLRSFSTIPCQTLQLHTIYPLLLGLLQLLIFLLRVFLIFRLRPMTMVLVQSFIISPQKSFIYLLPLESPRLLVLSSVRFQFICLIRLGFFILLIWAFLLQALILVLPWHHLFFNQLQKHHHSFLHFSHPFPPSLLSLISLLALAQGLLYLTFIQNFSQTRRIFNSPISFLTFFHHLLQLMLFSEIYSRLYFSLTQSISFYPLCVLIFLQLFRQTFCLFQYFCLH